MILHNEHFKVVIKIFVFDGENMEPARKLQLCDDLQFKILQKMNNFTLVRYIVK